VKFRTTPDAVEAILSRRHNWPRASDLRRVVWGDEPVTLSRLESLFIEVLHDADLPMPETNRPVGSRYVDCRWPAHRLTVELDSYRYHGTRHGWERDIDRERQARARGDEFRRYTWRDVAEDPEPMLADLRALLTCQLRLEAA
jgi:very-short-patch-repair endonuclease